jgi:hypothetical protein
VPLHTPSLRALLPHQNKTDAGSGYSLYPTALYGRVTPCYRMLATPISVPPQILVSISSAVEASLTSIEYATTAIATTTESSPAEPTTTEKVNVIINQVFVIGLPCAVGGDFDYHHSLSSAAKAGIAAGASVVALIAAIVALWWCWCMRTRRSTVGHNQLVMNIARVGRGNRNRDDIYDDDRVELVTRGAQQQKFGSRTSASTLGGSSLVSPPFDQPDLGAGYLNSVHDAARFQTVQQRQQQQQQQREALLPVYHGMEHEAGGHELVEAGGRSLMEMDGGNGRRR